MICLRHWSCSKKEHTAEEYDELVAFYSSDEWKAVEREHLNSDRRYYEKRKAIINPEEKEVATKKKYYDPEPFQLRAEEKFTNGFDDLFDDPVLQSCYRELTERQQEVIRMFFCDNLTTAEIAEKLCTSVRNIQKIKKCALEKLKTLHVKTTTGQQGSLSDYDCKTDDNVSGKPAGNIRSGEIRVQTHSANHIGADNELIDEFNQPVGEAVITGWETERGILLEAERIRRTQYETQSQADWNSYSNTIDTADIVDTRVSLQESYFVPTAKASCTLYRETASNLSGFTSSVPSIVRRAKSIAQFIR